MIFCLLPVQGSQIDHCLIFSRQLYEQFTITINNSCMTHLIKDADDTTIQANVSKFQPDESRDTVNQYFEWSDDNCMPCNLEKCKELYLQKKCNTN